MFFIPSPLRCEFTLRCKGCGEHIPAPLLTLPDRWIVAGYPLCGERRRYLPSEIFAGRLSYKLLPQRMGPRSGGQTEAERSAHGHHEPVE